MGYAQGLIRTTAILRWGDKNLQGHEETHCAWSAGQAIRMAWKRAKSLMLSGEAVCFDIRHEDERLLLD